MAHTHTIPVDPSLSPKEAWLEICLFTRRVTYTGSESWVVVNCDEEECVNIDRSKTHRYFNNSFVSGPGDCDCKECNEQKAIFTK